MGVAALLLACRCSSRTFGLHVMIIVFYYVILARELEPAWRALPASSRLPIMPSLPSAPTLRACWAIASVHRCGSAYPAGVLLAAVFGYVLGRLVLRMRAIYLAIASWAFAETVHIFLTASYGFTRGELGLSVKPMFGNVEPLAYYFTFLALTVVVLLGIRALINSPIGYFMRAIKDDELRAKSLGIDTTRVKVAIFSISSAIAGLAGAFYAHYITLLSPQMVDFSEMAKIVIMVVIGGFGTFLGPDHRRGAGADRHDLPAEIRRMEPRGLRPHRHPADALQHGGARPPCSRRCGVAGTPDIMTTAAGSRLRRRRGRNRRVRARRRSGGLGRWRQGDRAREVACAGWHHGDVGGRHLGAGQPSHAGGRHRGLARPETLDVLARHGAAGLAGDEDELWQALAENSAPMLRFLEDKTPLVLRAGQPSRLLCRGAGRQAVRPHGLADADQPLHPVAAGGTGCASR